MSKRFFASLILGWLLAALASAGHAQSGPAAPAPQPGAAPSQALPAVESVDILKQDQAQRTQDQPGNLSPTWRIIKEGTKNYSSLPGQEMGVLIQPKAQFPGQTRATTAGQAWREYRNGPLTQIGGWLLVAAVAGVIAVYLIFGPMRLQGQRSGRLIERFTVLERIAHWTTAISFVVLAVSGLTMLFGKYVLLPVFGHALFGWLSYLLKTLHNFVGPLFAVSLTVTFILFVKDNFPRAGDLKWLRTMGGMFSGKHAPAGRFNAGEKLWFWGGVTVLGLIVSASGFVLDYLVPGIASTRSNMQIAHVIHVIGAVLIIAASIGHIYMGTLGQEGAYQAMRTGYVDDTWAQQHHDLWYEDIESGKVPRVRTGDGAAGAGAPPGALSQPL